jgi:GTP-binding protein HflX
VLGELGIETRGDDAKLVEVWNKIDLVESEDADALRAAAARTLPPAVCISAQTGEGLDALLAMIEERLNAAHALVTVTIAPGEGALANWLHENTEIVERTSGEAGEITYRVRISPAKHAILLRRLERAGHAGAEAQAAG